MSWANPSSINLSNGDVQKNAARKLLNLPTWESYRKLAYGGVDGTGSLPIMFGQYLDAFAFNHSQSNKNLVVNTSILSGMKWLNFFRVEYQFDRSYLWDEDGTPTRGLLEWGELIDRVHTIDDQLTRLNNDWIMFEVGQIGSEDGASASGFHRGNFDSEQSAAKNREFGLSAVQVQSLSKAHGLPAIYEVKMERTELDPGWVNTITVTLCWCYGSETFDMDPRTIKAVWGFNGTERPGAVYLAAVLAAHAQKGLPAFSIYGHDVQDATDTGVPADVAEKILRFARCAVAVGWMKNKAYVNLGGVAMGIAGSYCDASVFQKYLGIRAEWVDMTEIIRRITLEIYDHEEYDRALA